jgi:hypothetical protein
MEQQGYYTGHSSAALSMNRRQIRLVSTGMPAEAVAVIQEIAVQAQCSLAKVAKTALLDFIRRHRELTRPELAPSRHEASNEEGTPDFRGGGCEPVRIGHHHALKHKGEGSLPRPLPRVYRRPAPR